jgi:type II secretory pathway component PulJ
MKIRRKILDGKLKSFTIIELLVALMLSSLVVLISYTFYDIVSKQFHKKQNFYKNITALSKFHLEMQEEFDKCESIYNKENSLIFMKPQGDSICYTFYDTCITREWEDINDTIFLSPENLLCSFNSKEITEGQIDEVSFDIMDKGEKFSLSFAKEISPVVELKDNK